MKPTVIESRPENRPVTPLGAGGYIPTLDGWRAVAVILVVLAHTTHTDQTFQWYQGFGGWGVSIFFGLSGLLVCSRLLAEVERRGQFSVANFYIRRGCRILPAAWAYLTAVGLLSQFGVIRCPWPEVRSCLFIYRNYVSSDPGVYGCYTAHFWSLVVEEHFYLLFPIVLFVLKPGRAFWALPVLLLAAAVWRVMDSKHGIVASAFDVPPSYFRTDHRIDALLWGCWWAIALSRVRGRLRNGWVRGVGAGAFVVLLLNVLGYNPLHKYVVALTFPSAFIPLVLIATAVCYADPWSRILESAPFRWVGRLSYSLYLWQQLFFVQTAEEKATALEPLQDWPWNWVALFVCAVTSYYLLERPLTRMGHRLTRAGTAGRV